MILSYFRCYVLFLMLSFISNITFHLPLFYLTPTWSNLIINVFFYVSGHNICITFKLKSLISSSFYLFIFSFLIKSHHSTNFLFYLTSCVISNLISFLLFYFVSSLISLWKNIFFIFLYTFKTHVPEWVLFHLISHHTLTLFLE